MSQKVASEYGEESEVEEESLTTVTLVKDKIKRKYTLDPLEQKFINIFQPKF